MDRQPHQVSLVFPVCLSDGPTDVLPPPHHCVLVKHFPGFLDNLYATHIGDHHVDDADQVTHVTLATATRL